MLFLKTLLRSWVYKLKKVVAPAWIIAPYLVWIALCLVLLYTERRK